MTGSAGFIGSNLTDHLLANGYRVIGIDNMRTGILENLAQASRNRRFNHIKADVSTLNLEAHIDEKVDVIFHLAAVASVVLSVKFPMLVHQANTTSTVNILDYARKNDISRVVLASSAAVYGTPSEHILTETSPAAPISPYGASKLAAEEYMHTFGDTYGIEDVILRLFNVYGPRQVHSDYSGVVSIFANRILKKKPIVIDGDGTQTRSFVYVEDVCKIMETCAREPKAAGETFNLAGPEVVNILELANIMRRLAKATNLEITHGPPRIGDIQESIGSIEKAQRVLGFEPKVSLEEGLKRTMDWYKIHWANA